MGLARVARAMGRSRSAFGRLLDARPRGLSRRLTAVVLALQLAFGATLSVFAQVQVPQVSGRWAGNNGTAVTIAQYGAAVKLCARDARHGYVRLYSGSWSGGAARLLNTPTTIGEIGSDLPADVRTSLISNFHYSFRATLAPSTPRLLRIGWFTDDVTYSRNTHVISAVRVAQTPDVELFAPSSNWKLRPPVTYYFLYRVKPRPGIGKGPPYDGWKLGRTKLPPDIARELLINMTQGKPPFRPELGQHGKVQWFTTEGDPYVGSGARGRGTIETPAIIDPTREPRRFNTRDLESMADQYARDLEPEAAQQMWDAWQEKFGPQVERPNFGADPRDPKFFGSPKQIDGLEKLTDQAGERNMWNEVGRLVAEDTPSGVGQITVEQGRFSRTSSGEFTLVADPEAMTIPGGINQYMQTLEAQGITRATDPILFAAADEAAGNLAWAAGVQSGLRTAGFVGLALGVAVDGYRFATSPDKVETGGEIAGGWMGAYTAATLVGAALAPGDLAGPAYWLFHAGAVLVAGAVGYSLGQGAVGSLLNLVRGSPCNGMS
jgi:hypothetical protein